jgi:hypothetical protein
MDKLPPLERTSNETGRVVLYHIQQGDTNFNIFYLYKSVVLPGGHLMEDKSFLYGSNDYDLLNDQVLAQGFRKLPPFPDDDPRILMVYK